jgi:hypothetical protein
MDLKKFADLKELATLNEKAKPLLLEVDSRLAIVRELEKMGSFAEAIGKAILVADSTNLATLSAGFSRLILQAHHKTQGETSDD